MRYHPARDFPQHYLTRNYGSWTPSRYIVLDTETTPVEIPQGDLHVFKLGWTRYVERRPSRDQDTEEWKEWENGEVLCRYLAERAYGKSNLYVFAHNAQFDMQAVGFAYFFTEWGWEYVFHHDQGPTFILRVEKDDRSIIWISTTNYYNASLAKIGEWLGKSKGEVDFESVSDAELSGYCRRDTEIASDVLEHWMAFVKQHRMGRFGYTRGSQALHAYRHRFMHHRIGIHREEDILDLERKAYMGGRTECYQIGDIEDGPFVDVDRNSQYPWIMHDYEFPTRLVDYQEDPPLNNLPPMLDRWCVVAEVELNTPAAVYAVRMHGRTCFPTGRFTAYLCTAGLQHAVDYGHVERVKRINCYEKATIFREFVEYFYMVRQEYQRKGEIIGDKTTKLLLNSLYGKFGQRQDEVEIEPCPGVMYEPPEQVWDATTGERQIISRLFNVKVTKTRGTEAKHAFPAIAAHITEYGRLALWEDMSQVGLDRVLKCDTDGFTIRYPDHVRLLDHLDPERLGALDLEHYTQRLIIHGPKDYETDTSMKIKGIPKRAVQIRPGMFQYEQFGKFATHVREGIGVGVLVRQVTKSLKREYRKGTVAADGRVTPYRVEPPRPPPELPF